MGKANQHPTFAGSQRSGRRASYRAGQGYGSLLQCGLFGPSVPGPDAKRGRT